MIAFCVVSAEFQIPNPRADEDADVTWALTTACKLQQCGEEVDAVRWVRRAASTAADAGDDERALELFRVAVELANSVSERSDDEDTLQQLRRVVATPLGRSGVPSLDPELGGAATVRQAEMSRDDTLTHLPSSGGRVRRALDPNDITVAPFTQKAAGSGRLARLEADDVTSSVTARHGAVPTPSSTPSSAEPFSSSPLSEDSELSAGLDDRTMTSLASFRVAVLADADGSPRVIPMKALAAMLHGASAAVLVASSPEDAERIRALLQND